MNDNLEIAGVFTILEKMVYKTPDGHALYRGKCSECGFVRIAKLYDLKQTTRCTHSKSDGRITSERVHWDNQRIKKIYYGMKRRCYSKTDKCYRWYGAKGVKICDEWLHNPKKFEEWALHNGYEDTLTIDRMDESKDYCPENCRWITDSQNSKFKSSTEIIDASGESHTGRDWSMILGLGQNVINRYVERYGLENTVKFIERYMKNPGLVPFEKNKSIYSMYMC